MSNRPSLGVQTLIVESESVNDDSWMTSYIDVFVLMTSIFVVLFMMSKQQNQTPVITPEKVNPALSLTEEKPSYLTDSSSETEVSILQEAALLPKMDAYQAWIQKIKNTIHDNGLASHVSFIENVTFSSLEIRSNVLFSSGEARMARSGESLLEKLVPVLEASQGLVFIEGHTDNQAIHSGEFASNWELAAARATEVLQFFVLEGIPKEKLRAVSYGDTKPVVANNTEAQRQQNRRVSILLQKPVPAL